MRASFIHVADTHLGYEQYGVRERFNDFSRTFWNIIAMGSRGCNFYVTQALLPYWHLLCKTVFHRSRPGNQKVCWEPMSICWMDACASMVSPGREQPQCAAWKVWPRR